MSAPNALPLHRMVLALGTVTILAAALLAGVYVLTKKPIADAEPQARLDAIAAVTARFDNDPVAEASECADGLVIYPVSLGGKPAGAAVETFSDAGFAGRIRLMVGLDANGRVTGYRVISHAETPGLGARMDPWFRDPQGRRSIIGTGPAAAPLAVSRDGGQVDAITAATITSRAFLEAVNRAAACYNDFTTKP